MLSPVTGINVSSELKCPYENDTFTPDIWDFTITGDSVAALVGVVIVELLIYLTALFWNLFIVIFMMVKREKLKEPPNVFLFAIAITDLVATVVTAPFYVGTVIRGEWFFGNTDCERQGFCMAVGFLLSLPLLYQVNLLAAMAFDRFLAIAKPLHYSRYMTTFRAVVIVIGAFIFSAVPAMTPLFGFGVFFYDGRLGACIFRWTGQPYYVGFFVALLIIPIAIITVFTLITYCKIRSFLSRRYRHHTRRFTQRSELPRQQRHYNRQQRNLLWLFTTLLVILGVCWFPGIASALIGLIIGNENLPGPLLFVALMLVLCNLAANPISHAIFREEIRKTFTPILKVICCHHCRKLTGEASESSSSSHDLHNTAATEADRGDADGASYKENGRGLSPGDQENGIAKTTPLDKEACETMDNTICETITLDFTSERGTPVPKESNASTPTEGVRSPSVRFSPVPDDIEEGTAL